MGVRHRARLALVAASLGVVHAGCTTIEGSDDPLRDPGPSSSEPAADASPVSRDDHRDDACEFAAGATGSGTIRVVYVVPSDRDVDARYQVNLEDSLRHVQLWLRDHTEQRTSILVHEPVVEVVHTSHPAAYYASNPVGTDRNLDYWYNATTDALAAVSGSFDDPDNIWLFYVAADPACGQATGTSGHVALFPENDLRGLVGDPRVPTCPGGEDGYGRCRWVGGMALLLAFALGVPDAAACTDSDPATACDNDLLFRLGYTTYPVATLSPDQLAFLAGSPFVRAAGLPDCELSCNSAALP